MLVPEKGGIIGIACDTARKVSQDRYRLRYRKLSIARQVSLAIPQEKYCKAGYRLRYRKLSTARQDIACDTAS
jgi:hypothetical protein